MARNAAVNVDEETAKAVCDSLDCPLLTYGISGKADLFARDIEITETGVSLRSICATCMPSASICC